MQQKERLDVLLVEKGLCESREKAKATIMAGLVYVDNKRVDKAGTKVLVSAPVTVKGKVMPYVGRGGLKLEKAIASFSLSLEAKTMLDIGASTGGFTDCALQHGAAKVFALDVGYGQLAWSLRTDARVVNMERTNIRYVTCEDIGEPVDFISIDVSFISILKIMPAVVPLLRWGGQMVTLIKPQFEAGRECVGKGGIVRNEAVHREVLLRVIAGIHAQGISPLALTFSPIKGADGNIEYLLFSCKEETPRLLVTPTMIDAVVKQSHEL
ncbi:MULTISPECIES: TlyA family RNA methyltransferase [Megasphaera]|uniref:Ribosomal RNA large subunit methyltransferase J n=1 Tax=Megasphaera hutchinsoni TaxID=1588748 RepID=A0A134CLL6_9FIRM|nr:MULTISPECIES: TlyA family RNA methyltransferase [Megasphaera]EGS32856.1 ribosomal RNA large subunit methyltransferase J [Megasphaera sp. UPII 135-E]KXB93110.1 ribosomal RNA large subunit methyltransferase J [Megasphaera hutchinsoni]MUP58612.1 TlyA family rRNA (cytidine-2'-O)-methyltransferase [Veillonellaceae bacterium M2-4]